MMTLERVKDRTHAPRLSLLALSLAIAFACFRGEIQAQEESLPGVRGALYESPSFGWILPVPEPEWRIVNALSIEGNDLVHLVADVGDGVEAYVVSFADEGYGSQGCAEDMVDILATVYAGQSLEGWQTPEVEFEEYSPEAHAARVRVVNPEDPALDILAYVRCDAGDDGLLIGEALLRTARDVDTQIFLSSPTPLWPGKRHTGRARDGPSAGPPEEGVLLFLSRSWPLGEWTDSFPFSCIDQETFARPPEAPPPGMGYFACDGQIVNVDTIPATIDLADIALGCDNVPASEALPTSCPSAPVRPSHTEFLRAPAEVSGSTLTLQPGESAEVVLWYALPAGDPPLDILYLEPDRRVLVGPTFFSAGTGNRPKVRMGR
jgi:hypothetical protein